MAYPALTPDQASVPVDGEVEDPVSLRAEAGATDGSPPEVAR